MELNEKLAVVVDCFNHYDYRIKYMERYLNAHGYKMTMLTSDFSHARHMHLSEKEKNIQGAQYIHVPEYHRNISLQRVFSHFVFARRVMQKVFTLHPDIVICEVPPNYVAHLLAKNKKLLGYKLIFDVIDLWPESFPRGDSHLFPFEVWRGWRNKSLKAADDILLECNYYRQTLNNVVSDDKIRVLPIMKDPLSEDWIDEWRKNINDKPEVKEIRLGYLGSINSLIDVDKMCECVRRLQSIAPVVVRIIGDGATRQELIRALQSAGAQVDFHGMVFDSHSIFQIFSDCHFGLNIYHSTLNIGLTIKSLDYFRMGMPILNTISGDTRELVEKYGVGINVSSWRDEDVQMFLRERVKMRERTWKVFNQSFSADEVMSSFSLSVFNRMDNVRQHGEATI